MAAHAALPLIRTRENRPSRSQGARWTANSARCNVLYRFDILFPSTVRTFAPYLASRHFHSLSRPLLPRALLASPVIPYVWRAASSSDVLLSSARLVFGADHSPLSLRIWPRLGTLRVGRDIRGPWILLSTQADTYSCRAWRKFSRNSLAETIKKLTNEIAAKAKCLLSRDVCASFD